MLAPPGSRFFTAANLLSLSRLPLGAAFWVTVGPGPWIAPSALGVLTAAAATDMLDGHLARRAGADPAGAGSWLDPTCDKLFVGAVVGALHFERHVPLGVLALIVSRELVQLPIAIAYRLVPAFQRRLRYDFRASVIGKAATISQFVAIGALMLRPSARAPIALAFVLGMLALAVYIRRAMVLGRRHLETHEEPPTS
jgi:phosphatidylglycerophosphate synthase